MKRCVCGTRPWLIHKSIKMCNGVVYHTARVICPDCPRCSETYISTTSKRLAARAAKAEWDILVTNSVSSISR